MAQTQKPAAGSIARAGKKRISDKFAEINNEGRNFSSDENRTEDRRSGSFTEGWNRPTQGARSTGYRSFDEDDRDKKIYGHQSGSNVTRESRGPVRGYSNYDEGDFEEDSRSSGHIQQSQGLEREAELQREDERNFSPGEKDIRSRRDEQRPSRSEREFYGDQSYGSYDSGTFGSRSAANRGERPEPRERDERSARGNQESNYGREHFGPTERGRGYDIRKEDDDYQGDNREFNRDERHYEDQPRNKDKRNEYK